MEADAAAGAPRPTSVRVVLGDRDGRLLLLRRAADDDHNPGLWEFPGGGIDPGESARDAAARELREEVGLEVTAGDLADWARYEREQEGRTRHTKFFSAACRAEDCEPTLSHEHDAWRWAADAAELDGTTPSTRWAATRLAEPR
jgi:8-oxo-dGTP diphosphatase